MSSPRILTRRELNRALLARQSLLDRVDMSPPDVVHHLVGLRAQVPDAPHVALWTRVSAYNPAIVSARIAERQMIRLTTMRGTIHLFATDDALALQSVFQPVIGRTGPATRFYGLVGPDDPDEILRTATALLATSPMGRTEIGRALAERWPRFDAAMLGAAATALVPCYQVPPRGQWRSRAGVAWAPLVSLPGAGAVAPATVADLIPRYLRAFGPASMADFGKWSGIGALRPAFESLRGSLITYRGPDGRELFDVPEGPMPDPDTPAPPRFLPEYDNVILSHADRSRIMPQRELPTLPAGYGGTSGTLLVDGMLAATWRITTTATAADLVVVPLAPIDPSHHDGIVAEAERLLSFVHPTVTERTVRFDSHRDQVDSRVSARRCRQDT